MGMFAARVFLDRRPEDRWLTMALAWPVGAALVQALVFVAYLTGLPPFTSGWIAAAALSAILAAVDFRRGRAESQAPPAKDELPPSLPQPPRYVCLVVALALMVVLWVHLGSLSALPWGGGDSVAIWNLRAKSLFFLSGDQWDQAFSPLIPYSHPDYPFGIPVLVAGAARAMGSFTPVAPAIISAAYATAMIGLIAAGLRRNRGPVWLGLLLLLGAPRFLESTAHQCADVPMAVCLLAAGVLMLRFRPEERGPGGWLLTGLLAGATAVIKNEGLALAVIFGAVILLWCLIARRLRARVLTVLPPFLSGLLAMLAVALAFKLTLAPSSDLAMNNPLPVMLNQAADISRWGRIVGWAMVEPLRWRHWGLLLGPVSIFALWRVFTLWRAGRNTAPVLMTIVWGLMLSYLAVYLVTPHPLGWHLATALHRLVFHVWPLLVLIACLPRPKQTGTT